MRKFFIPVLVKINKFFDQNFLLRSGVLFSFLKSNIFVGTSRYEEFIYSSLNRFRCLWAYLVPLLCPINCYLENLIKRFAMASQYCQPSNIYRITKSQRIKILEIRENVLAAIKVMRPISHTLIRCSVPQ